VKVFEIALVVKIIDGIVVAILRLVIMRLITAIYILN
jgi:hypothetical protein